MDAQKPGAENKDETKMEGEGAPTDATNGDAKSEDKKDQVSPRNFLVFIQCCGSGMFILDPITATKEKGEKIFGTTFFVATSIEIYFIFFTNTVKKNIWASLRRILVLLPKKFLLCSQKMGLGSEKNLFQILDPGVKKYPDPQCCFYCLTVLQSGMLIPDPEIVHPGSWISDS